MTDLRAQRRLAADVLDVGKSRVWFDPDAEDEIADAITREDIRELVDREIVREKSAKGNSRGRARERNAKRAYGHREGPGTRKGSQGARRNAKRQWTGNIRAQRRTLRALRDDGVLDRTAYRESYNKASGGEFRSVQYLLNYIENNYDVEADLDEYNE